MVSRILLLLTCKRGCCAASSFAWRTSLRLDPLSLGHAGRFTLPLACAERTLTLSSRVQSTERAGSSAVTPKAVIFDVGGVVVPSPFPVFVRFEERHGLSRGSVIETIRRMGGSGAFAKLERGEYMVEEFSDPFAREFASLTGVETAPGIFRELIEELCNEEDFKPHPAVLDTISRLREKGVKTAILTNNFRYQDGTTLYPRENLKADVVVESCVEGVRKPETAIFTATLERLGVRPEEAVFLDDIGSNLKAAKEIGIRTIKVGDIGEALGVLERVLGGEHTAANIVPGTAEVSPKLAFPADGLIRYLRENHNLNQEAPPLIRQFQHGQSNPTYYIEYDGAQLVLRKKPPGKLLPSAHAVEREYRVMKATHKAGVPIPVLLSLCEDESVIGTPFYLMRYVSGQVLKDPSLPGLEPTQRKAVYSELCRVLAAIHRVDIEEAGLTDFGKHGNYVGRQVVRWSKQYSASHTHSIPAMDRLMQWLGRESPQQDRTTVVHGDYRLDNLIFARSHPEVKAVLDWELSTLGDPVSDLAYACIPYHMEPGLPHLKGLQGLNLAALGIPSEEEFVAEYCRLSGTEGIPDWYYYLAFTFFRVAAILQGVYKRSLQNQSSADNARTVGMMAEVFAKKGWDFAQQQQSMRGLSGKGPASDGSRRQYSTHVSNTATLRGRETSRVPHRSTSTTRHSRGKRGEEEEVEKEEEEENSVVAVMTGDVSSYPSRLAEMREMLLTFMEERVLPAEEAVLAHQLSGDRWTPLPIIDELKSEARSQGLWNLFLPLESDPEVRHGAGLTNLEYAPMAEIMGQSIFASEIFNCSAPDTGNMEVLVKYGTEKQKATWLAPLLAGKIRSCFAMTEPAVASSDATNIQSSITADGDHYILNGRKWWISGAMDPRCKICVFMGKTDPDAPKHKQQSMILVPMATPGIEILRPLTVFQYDDAPSGHAELQFTDVSVPMDNILLGEGRGFEIAQGRLGPGRIHHCMRLIGMAERALRLMTSRVKERVAFGKPLSEQGTILSDIAQSRMEIDQARLLTLLTAHKMDTVGNKAARREVAMIKVVAPQMAQRVADRAMQAHGAMGLSADRPLAHFFSWARILRLADGPDEVHAAAVGKMELRRAGR